MRGLEGKTAVVTGGATLIGAAVVRAFVAAGTRVAVADIDEEGGGRLADELGDAVLFSPTDIRDDAQLEQLAAATAARFGGIDFLVNLACSYVDEGFASPRADWLESLNVNVASAVMAAKAVHPHMLARGGGAIVNFASISSKVAQTGRWLYPVSKAAIVQLTRNMAMDLAGDGIRVNSVSPGLDVVEGDGGADGRRPREDGPRRRAVPPARPRRRPGGGGERRPLPLLGRRVVRHRRRLRGRRRLLGDGPRAGRAGDSQACGMNTNEEMSQ